MDNIEAVKKILRRDRDRFKTVGEWITAIEDDAKEICRLFEEREASTPPHVV